MCIRENYHELTAAHTEEERDVEKGVARADNLEWSMSKLGTVAEQDSDEHANRDE